MTNEEELQLADYLLKKLFPINRSITGEGLRLTLNILKEYIPLEIEEVKSGTKVNNWIVPKEWKLNEAYIEDSNGKKIIDAKNNNLHVINYSVSTDKTVSLEELKKYIHTRPDILDAIPYITSYYKDTYGFCMSQNQLDSLKEDNYHMYIDSKHFDGSLNYGHLLVKGKSEKEILISTYVCHPSMANNELSGPIVSTLIYNRLKNRQNRFSYRFIFCPETIGSITYLSKYGKIMKEKTYTGFVLTCIGGDFPLCLKLAKKNDAPINVVYKALRNNEFKTKPFDPRSGSDERQYCSPGYNLPVGQISKGLNPNYPYYHTSLDNLDFITAEQLIKSVEQVMTLIDALELDGYYVNKNPYGEVKLDKYNLYPTINDISDMERTIQKQTTNKILLVLNYSDGETPLSYLSEQYRIGLMEFKPVIDILKKYDLIDGPFLERRKLE